jgi:hypothetical protein
LEKRPALRVEKQAALWREQLERAIAQRADSAAAADLGGGVGGVGAGMGSVTRGGGGSGEGRANPLEFAGTVGYLRRAALAALALCVQVCVLIEP